MTDRWSHPPVNVSLQRNALAKQHQAGLNSPLIRGLLVKSWRNANVDAASYISAGIAFPPMLPQADNHQTVAKLNEFPLADLDALAGQWRRGQSFS